MAMGLYVEVHCDVRKDGYVKVGPNNSNSYRCWSARSDNAQGRTVAEARSEARKQGWKVGPGNSAVCPGCKK